MTKITFAIAIAIQTFSSAFAGPAYDLSTDNQWSSAEQASVGNIGWMSENFVDQVLSNPAYASLDERSFVMQWLNLNVNFTQGFGQTIRDIQDLRGAKQNSQASQILNAFDKMSRLFGRRIGARSSVSLFATKMGGFFLIPNATLGIDGEARVPAWPRAAAQADAFGGVAVGYGRALGESVDVGVTLRPGYRYFFLASYDSSRLGADLTSTEASNEDLLRYGGALYLPVDAGFIFHLSEDFNLNVAARNIGGAEPFDAIDTAPEKYPMHLALGLQYWCFESDRQRLVIATELQDTLGIASSSDLFLRWQWATQYRYRLARPLFLGANVGLESGYSTFGLLAELSFFKLIFSTETKEVGTYPGQKGERRVAVATSLETEF